ncbi:uncharacterized protein TRIADDRAFT_55691 [Trichoplax adhaerens]|uniref:RWD domain-containing protein n=1 Tax=Trichoplax adhaerens TaxID=10228 RepID=B3RVL1_TRIAD|nr:hypothetical protein TRIADDRAFT_55691 [Trichoplax adhaerens]EDV26016.1 hypothetical protein TRIADDRAFT_55691 [Trichoplax adhaerens]|eukprot:XP_002112049.1 hypothetical protein TRIADDRAFT_55691 [Trichoplax adhaerens]
MAIDGSGARAALASRRLIALVDLDEPDKIVSTWTRPSKFDVSNVEWNPHVTSRNFMALLLNQKVVIAELTDGAFEEVGILRGHTRVIRQYRIVSKLCTHTGISQVRWNKSNPNIMATAHDAAIRIWDNRKGNCPLLNVTAHSLKIHGLDWKYNQGNVLVSCGQDCCVKIWDTSKDLTTTHNLSHTAAVWRARFTPFKNGLVTASMPTSISEQNLLLWNVSSFSNNVKPAPIYAFEGYDGVIVDFRWRYPFNFSGDKYTLVTWSTDRALRLWTIDKEMIAKFIGPEKETSSEYQYSNNSVTDKSNDHRSKIRKSSSISQQRQLAFDQEYNNICFTSYQPLKVLQDFKNRSCLVTGKYTEFTVSININFPEHYPSAPPRIKFVHPTTLPNNLQGQLSTSLNEEAANYMGRNCLEACINQIYSFLSGRDDPGKPPDPSTRVPPARTSGGRFNSSGLFVSFHRPFSEESEKRAKESYTEVEPIRKHGNSIIYSRQVSVPVKKSQKHIMRGHSSDTLENRQNPSHVENIEPVSSNPKFLERSVSNESRLKFMVAISDLTKLEVVNKQLGKDYKLLHNEKYTSEACKANIQLAELIGRSDLIQTWSILSEITVNNLSFDESDPWSSPFYVHPFGRKLVMSLIDYYINLRDVQTLAMMICLLGGTGYISSDQSKRQCCLLDPSRRKQYISFIKSYSNILYSWGFLISRAEIMKYLKKDSGNSLAEFLVPHEVNRTNETVCKDCKHHQFRCSVCNGHVKGISIFCFKCNHGGHYHHLKKWFESNNCCALGCGCCCEDYNFVNIGE